MTLASCLTRVLGVKWGPAWSPLSALVSALGRANGQGALGKRGGYAFPWLVVGSVQHDVKRGGMSCSLCRAVRVSVSVCERERERERPEGAQQQCIEWLC